MEGSAPAPDPKHTPSLTLPQLLAFAAFLVFVGFALLASADKAVKPDELDEIRKLTLFLIAALLPSDALIRFGRNWLFRSVPDPAEAAAQTPRSTLAQLLAFAGFLVVALATLVSDEWITSAEFTQINEVARVLIVALLPSDAAIRFGRALYLRSQPTAPTAAQLSRV